MFLRILEVGKNEEYGKTKIEKIFLFWLIFGEKGLLFSRHRSRIESV